MDRKPHPQRNRRGGRRGGNQGSRGRGGHTGRGGHGWQGGRGEKGAAHERKPVRLGFMALQEALKEEPDKIALDFGSQRCLPAFHDLVDSREMKPDMVKLLLKVLAKVCECRSKEYLYYLLSEVNDSIFLLKHVKAYLCRMTLGNSPSDDFVKIIANATTLFHTLLRSIPSSSESLPIVDLLITVKKLQERGLQFDSDVLGEIKKLSVIQEESYAEVESQVKQQDSDHSGMATGKQFLSSPSLSIQYSALLFQ